MMWLTMPFSALSNHTSSDVPTYKDFAFSGHTSSSFLNSGYLYSTSSSSLLLRGALNYSIDIVLELTHRSTTSEGLAQDPYVVARLGFEPVTLWTQGTEHTTEPPHLFCCLLSYLFYVTILFQRVTIPLAL